MWKPISLKTVPPSSLAASLCGARPFGFSTHNTNCRSQQKARKAALCSTAHCCDGSCFRGRPAYGTQLAPSPSCHQHTEDKHPGRREGRRAFALTLQHARAATGQSHLVQTVLILAKKMPFGWRVKAFP